MYETTLWCLCVCLWHMCGCFVWEWMPERRCVACEESLCVCERVWEWLCAWEEWMPEIVHKLVSGSTIMKICFLCCSFWQNIILQFVIWLTQLYSLNSFSFLLSHRMEPDPEYFCGACETLSGDVGPGWQGQWLKYGESNNLRRIWLCKPCIRFFWRDHTKLEAFHDSHSMNAEFCAFLQKELQRKWQSFEWKPSLQQTQSGFVLFLFFFAERHLHTQFILGPYMYLEIKYEKLTHCVCWHNKCFLNKIKYQTTLFSIVMSWLVWEKLWFFCVHQCTPLLCCFFATTHMFEFKHNVLCMQKSSLLWKMWLHHNAWKVCFDITCNLKDMLHVCDIVCDYIYTSYTFEYHMCPLSLYVFGITW